MRKTKIVCTIGPASESVEMLEKLIKAGMNVARLNFSHGTHEEHKLRIDNIKKIRQQLNKPVAIMLDTKGPEVRLGKFKTSSEELVVGQSFTLTTRDIEGDNSIVSISYKSLPEEVGKGTRILIADGLIELIVLDKNDTDVFCQVVNGGTVSDRKNVNIPGATSKLPAVTDRDIADINFGINNGIDFIAASFIRKASDIFEIRRILDQRRADHVQIIAKIENQQGVDNCDEILRVSDGLMVARGDLGVEIPTEDIPLVQKHLIAKANALGKPVITATQMMESMIRNPRPTRAEVTDIANAIFDGTDAVMLSGETAVGKYPFETVSTMATIAERTETALDYRKKLIKSDGYENINVTNAISFASCAAAMDLGASAIITPTQSGSTARMVSRYRPKAPIVAATPDEKVARKLSLSFGVNSVTVLPTESTDEMIKHSVDRALEAELIKNGDLVVITAGIPVGVAGTTNLIKVHVVGEVIARGMGIGSKAVTGKVCIIRNAEKEIDTIQEGDILVAEATDLDMIPLMMKAAAFIVEEGGLTSHAAIVGLELGKPVVVGVEKATDNFINGQIVTVDSSRGLIYKGRARVL
ncbi:MAG: pyruvate kinase [Lutispora sp.]|nr:pyruvate kinase [Lutispora sp.]MDD4834026.1 pyruvate kinase [Lutispora sp.]